MNTINEQKRILICGEDRIHIRRLKWRLREGGYSTEMAFSPLDAVHLFCYERGEFELVMLDKSLPLKYVDKDGREKFLIGSLRNRRLTVPIAKIQEDRTIHLVPPVRTAKALPDTQPLVDSIQKLLLAA